MNRRFGVVSLIGLPLAVVLALAGCTPADWEAGASAPVPTATSTSPTPTPTASAKPGKVGWEATPATCAALKTQIVDLRIDGGVLMNRITDRLNACSLLALPQCRVDAIMARMDTFGLKDGDFVIGEDRIDTTLPAFKKAGSLAFGKNGQKVTTREILAEVFTSDEPNLKAVTEAKVNQLIDQYPRKVILDPQNWEIVQYLVPATVSGNTGLDGTSKVSVGDTESAAGDAEWLFIDPVKCVVPTTNFDSMGNPVDPSTPEADKPVASVRPGCINANDGMRPRKDPSLDPGPRGNAPDGQGPNYDSGPGTLTGPLEQPKGTPYVAPADPTPTPGPTLTPDPAPAPSPEPSAPADPHVGCIPITGVKECP